MVFFQRYLLFFYPYKQNNFNSLRIEIFCRCFASEKFSYDLAFILFILKIFSLSSSSSLSCMNDFTFSKLGITTNSSALTLLFVFSISLSNFLIDVFISEASILGTLTPIIFFVVMLTLGMSFIAMAIDLTFKSPSKVLAIFIFSNAILY